MNATYDEIINDFNNGKNIGLDNINIFKLYKYSCINGHLEMAVGQIGFSRIKSFIHKT